MGLSFRHIASRLNISVGTVFNIFKIFEQTGSVDPKKARNRPECCKLDGHHQLYIIGLVLDNPSMYLGEICSEIKHTTGVEVTPSSICKLLRKFGLTRKKIQHVALQRSVEYRGAFVADISCYRKEMLVWVDEVGCDKRNMLRKFGYSLRGERAVCHRLLVRGKRVSAIAAMCCSGMLGAEVTTDSVNGEKFCEFVEGTLIPNMLPYDGLNETSIVVMDNCAIHHVQQVRSLLDDAGILLVYLPPYSPDYNPIEVAFGYVKQYLKKHDDVMAVFTDPKSLVQAAFDNINEELCQAWVLHSHLYH